MIVKVSEVAKICGVSVQTIYKKINSFSSDEFKRYLNQVETRFKEVTPEGLKYFKALYNIIDEPIKENDIVSADNEVIDILKEQLRIKDEQIAMLLEQNRNYQVLLKNEQDKLLPPSKIPFFKRIFGRKENLN
nr:unnamed protein product [uncultured bacterium]